MQPKALFCFDNILTKIDEILTKIDIVLAKIDKNIEKNTNILYKIINKIDYCRFLRAIVCQLLQKRKGGV